MNAPIPPDVLADLEQAARLAATGATDLEAARRISERAAAVREELRKTNGTVEVAVSLLREIRDEE